MPSVTHQSAREGDDEPVDTTPGSSPSETLASGGARQRILSTSPTAVIRVIQSGTKEGYSSYVDESITQYMQGRILFGVEDPSKGLVSAESLIDLINQTIDKDVIKAGTTSRLEEAGGTIYHIRHDNFASLGATSSIRKAVQCIFIEKVDELPELGRILQRNL
jgi:hypothetical protein